jgi:hypothetical protein
MNERDAMREELERARRELIGLPLERDEEDCVVWTSQIEPEEVRWLWTGRIPMGTLTLLDGDPGKGKSILATTLAAAVSTGRPMPGDSGIAKGKVLLVSLEDDPATQTVPRLIAAGADRDNVGLIQIEGTNGLSRLPALPHDIDRIHQAAKRQEAKLIVIDQLLAALSGEVNSDKSQDMSRVLAALVQVGQDTGAAVLALRHMNKNVGLDMIYRGIGSTGIIGTARSAMVLVDHPQNPGELLLATYKSNVGAIPKALGYRIAGHANGGGYIVWGDEIDLTADQAMSGKGDHSDDEPERSEAESWLLEALRDGELPAKQLRAEAEEHGFSTKNLRTARQHLGVIVTKRGGLGKSSWFWSLPERQADEGASSSVSPAPGASSAPSAPSPGVGEDSKETKEKERDLSPPQKIPVRLVEGAEDAEGAGTPRHMDQGASSGSASAPTPITAAPSYHPPAGEEVSPTPHAPFPATQNLIPWLGRDQIDLESWPGPWCPECTEEPVRQEHDLCPRCRLEVERLAERWRA